MGQYCRLLRSHVLGAKAGRKERQKTRAREEDKDIENKKTIHILVFSLST
jgi:hypothetical protein